MMEHEEGGDLAMRRSTVRRRPALIVGAIGSALLVCAVAIVAMLRLPGADAAPQAAEPFTTAYYAGCRNDAVAAPFSVPIWCSSTDQVLDDLVWTKWGGRASTATGVFLDNPCDCNGGTLNRYPIVVTFTHPVSVAGVDRYEQLQITFSAARPAWAYQQSMTFFWSPEGFVSDQMPS